MNRAVVRALLIAGSVLASGLIQAVVILGESASGIVVEVLPEGSSTGHVPVGRTNGGDQESLRRPQVIPL